MVSAEGIIVDVLSLTLKYSPLYLYAGLGEIISEKSGVVNLGIEGTMLISAFVTLFVDVVTRNPYIAILSSLAVSLFIAFIFGTLTVRLGFDQIVTGLAFYLFGLGFSYILYSKFSSSNPIIIFTNVQAVNIPFLSDIPIIGPILFKQNPLVYLAIFLVPLVYIFMNRTSYGLHVKAVGENPIAADNMGINVNRVRLMAVLFGGLTSGLAGAYFEIGFLQNFQFNVIGGRGFVALALIYFANWSPFRTLLGALVYNIADAGQSEFVQLAGPAFQTSSQLFAMVPYLFLLALIPVFGRKARPPKYIMVPYRKD
jgi:ABC-type uncharacterized transport system permease subunit